MKLTFTTLLVILIVSTSCSYPQEQKLSFYQKAALTMEAIYTHYSVEGTPLLRETFPFDEAHRVTYLSDESQNIPRQYAFLWPFSGTFTAVVQLYDLTRNPKYYEMLQTKVLPALAMYWDTTRTPYAYSSYITVGVSDRFYDDNVWIGIDYVDLYNITGNPFYLERAKAVWEFVMSGYSETLGGGIYWVEQNRNTKNTCSNAPGAVYAFKMYEATGDRSFFEIGKRLYHWTQYHLQADDYIYYDYIRIDGHIDRRRFTYNSGQMMQAAAILYRLTGDTRYLVDAQNIARASFNYFWEDYVGRDGKEFRIMRRGDTWFVAVMLRGFIELYHIDGNRTYIDSFKQNLEYAWQHARDEYGLFTQDFSGRRVDRRKWVLAQAGMVEMFARLAKLAD